MELNRLLESAAFRTSKRCREFLAYIVQHTINGPSGALKERSIGVEVFRLPKDFDTGQHTVVRVTANEVRKKLAQQYLAENGAFRPIKIDLPPGSYSAAFTWGTPPAEPPIPAWLALIWLPPTMPRVRELVELAREMGFHVGDVERASPAARVAGGRRSRS